MLTILCGDGANAAQSAHQPGNGGSHPTSSLQFVIKKITNKDAKMWVELWHYSRRIPTGKNICFGLFDGDELYAVIVYGIGVNPYQAKFLKVGTVLEIKRMCRSEPRRNFQLSRFISISSKMVCREFPYDCLVAFADPEQGHEGTVYKASGFKLHGKTNAEWHVVDGEGVIRHRRFAYRYAKRNSVSIKDARTALGLTRIQTQPKYRWVKYISAAGPVAGRLS